MSQQLTRRADKRAWWRWSGRWWRQRRLQPLVENAFDGAIAQILERQRTRTRAFEPLVADTLTQLQNAHHTRMTVDDLLVQQRLDDLCGCHTDFLRHRATHL